MSTAVHNPNPETDPITTGVKFVLGIAKGVSETQSVLFDKALWTVEQARQWLAEHGLKSQKVDKKGKFLRFRQRPPKYKQYATIEAGHEHNPENLGTRVSTPELHNIGFNLRIWAANDLDHRPSAEEIKSQVASENLAHPERLTKPQWDFLVSQAQYAYQNRINPSNLFGFGKKLTYSAAGTSKAKDAAYRAGQRIGDTGAFDSWYSKSGFDKPGIDRKTLKREFDLGVEEGEKGPSKPSGFKQGDKCPFWHWKGHEICRTEDGEYYDRKDPASRFESLRAVKKFIEDWEKGRKGNAALYTVIAEGNRKYAMARTIGQAREIAGRMKAEYGGASIWNGPKLVEKTNPAESSDISTETVESEIPVFRSGPQGFPGVSYLISYPELNQALAYGQAIKGVYPDVGVVCLEESEEKQPGGDYAVVQNANDVRVVEVDQVAEEADAEVRIENPSRRKGDLLRDMERPMVLGHELDRATLTPIHRPLPALEPGRDFGADPIWEGGEFTGKFRMVPSGDIVDSAERERRLQRNPYSREEAVRSFALQFFNAGRGFGTTIQSARTRVKKWSAEGPQGPHFKDLAFYMDALLLHEKLKSEGMTKAQADKEWRELHRRSNPEQAAADMYESFHGRPADRTLEIEEPVHEHDWLAELGDLTEMEVDTLSGYHAVIAFDSKQPKLASSEDGQQLFIVGGEQLLDLGKLHMSGSKWERDSMVIGEITNIVYRTEKSFDKFERLEYTHEAGEESKVRPQLVYEPKSPRLLIVGGQYRIEKPLIGTSPGIEN